VEYTVPEVSQSVVITRMAGRTPVPERESLQSFAAHQTSMVIFLSVQGMRKVVKELIAGGYPETTPATVIYKATWPDEQQCFWVL
jgi:precorrin-4/cobalt-precorrin-4 C11-methyltransferase